jgi:hypothetical protein
MWHTKADEEVKKKGVGFREHKTGRRRDRDDISEMKANAIPVVEDQDLTDADGDAIEVARSNYGGRGQT